jgi:hypothetical protein
MTEKSISSTSNKEKAILKKDPERLAKILKQNLARRKQKLNNNSKDED